VVSLRLASFIPKVGLCGRYDRVSRRLLAPDLTDRHFNPGVQYEAFKNVNLALVYKHDKAENGTIATATDDRRLGRRDLRGSTPIRQLSGLAFENRARFHRQSTGFSRPKLSPAHRLRYHRPSGWRAR
jgi:hypothetical protein